MKKATKKRKQNKTNHIIHLPLTVLFLCLAVFLFSMFFFLQDFFRYKKEDHANTVLAKEIRKVRNETDEDPFIKYAALWEQNHDFTGWLYIEDTKIDYPVMHTPNDPEYYLHRAFDRSDARSGCLFADAACSIDGNSLLIYGHHMKDGSMFGSLTDYRIQEFADEHPIIHFDSLTEKREYELLAVFYWDDSYLQNDAPFCYYEYTDFSSSEQFDTYIRSVKSLSVYDSDVNAAYGDRILTLSTCSYHENNGRFVVVAVSHNKSSPLSSDVTF